MLTVHNRFFYLGLAELCLHDVPAKTFCYIIRYSFSYFTAHPTYHTTQRFTALLHPYIFTAIYHQSSTLPYPILWFCDSTTTNPNYRQPANL